MASETPTSRVPWIAAGFGGVLLLLGVQVSLDVRRGRDFAEQSLKEAQAAGRAAGEARKAAEKAAAEIADLRAEFEMLATSVSAVERQVKELADEISFGGTGGNPFGPAQGAAPGGSDADQPFQEYSPELREALRKAAAAKGVALLEDRVVFPGRVNLRQGPMELLAAFPQGRTHEAVLVLTGEPGEDGALPEGLGATLNSSLMALGLRPGKSLQLLPGGRTIPAKGTPVHISVEWEEDGKPVRVRAEDLLWDRRNGRTMEEGRFIYVGSFFDRDGSYVPDLSGDAVACYSMATCVVDLSDPRAADDEVFVPCTPHLPPEGTKVRVSFSPAPIPPTRTWDPAEFGEEKGEGAAPAGGEGEGGK